MGYFESLNLTLATGTVEGAFLGFKMSLWTSSEGHSYSVVNSGLAGEFEGYGLLLPGDV